MPIIKKQRVIADFDIPALIARDVEYIAGDVAVQAWAESRFEYRAPRFSKTLDGPLTFSATTWTSLGTFPGLSLGTQGEASLLLIALCFLFDKIGRASCRERV